MRLEPDEYSLAREVRLLRQLIEASDNAGLKANLVKVLKDVLQQDEARSIRQSELLSRESVEKYADLLSQTIGMILREELSDEKFWHVMDRIQAAVSGTALPKNDLASQNRLLGRER